jgi:type II secretory ATPase GspE/PulE/Tfp pilus assembly ATPase PilB-like protein
LRRRCSSSAWRPSGSRSVARGLRGGLRHDDGRDGRSRGRGDLAHLAQDIPEPSDLLESEDEAPVIRLINALLTQAVKENASDIHIEPFENRS